MIAVFRQGFFALLFALSSLSLAHADEQMVPLAQSGEWTAIAHKTSMTAPPDVCVAANRAGVALRADGDSVQFRVIDESWSLPASVEGDLLIVIGSWKLSLAIGQNNNTSVSAELDPSQILELLTTMDKASTMAVTVGKAKPRVVSLVGSARVSNAFRTCAGIGGTNRQGGANPFQ